MTTKNALTKPADKRFRIAGKLRTALDLMVFGDKNGNPVDWDEAARTMNISTRSMRRSLERPAVRQYLQSQKQVLRAALSSKNLLRLDALADQRSNMNAAVNAIKAIEEGEPSGLPIDDDHRPGITISIIQAPAPAAPLPIVDVTPRPSPFRLPRDAQSQGGDE